MIDEDYRILEEESELNGYIARPTEVAELQKNRRLEGAKRLRIVCISDTHNRHRELPPLPQGQGHMLIHCGDFSYHGRSEQIKDFNEWLGTLDYAYKFVICGNHDRICGERLEHAELESLFTNAHYVAHDWLELTQFGSLKIFASSWEGCGIDGPDWSMFAPGNIHNKPKELEDETLMGRLSTDALSSTASVTQKADILITHIPPKGVLDSKRGEPVGHDRLLRLVLAAKPTAHIFGHVHRGGFDKRQGISFLNAAVDYRFYRGPIVFDYYYI